MIGKILRSLRQYKLQTLLTLIFIIGEVILEVLIPYITSDMVNGIKNSVPLEETMRTGGIMALAAIISLLCGAFAGNFSAKAWNYADFYQWGDNNTGSAKDQCKYSFYGFIRCDDGNNLWIINNGIQTPFPSHIPTAAELPVVRYIIPYPNLAIQRSAGAYKNYYGY